MIHHTPTKVTLHLTLQNEIGLFWGAHQRFFRSLCIAAKVDKAIDIAKKALDDGNCVLIGLQSTGEARSKAAAEIAGYDAEDGGSFDDYVSAPSEDLKRVILNMFPLPPRVSCNDLTRFHASRVD